MSTTLSAATTDGAESASDAQLDISFPADFLFGTSTASAQIETASDHDWRGVKTKDGLVFDRTCDHEKRRAEDVEVWKKKKKTEYRTVV